jgi:hypothetical protein
MNPLNGLFSSSRNNNPGRNPPAQDPSMRGGLPKVVDMLKVMSATSFNRKDINIGNKVLLPDEILHILSNMYHNGLPYPMVFSISSLKSRKTVYAGVLEFVAPKNIVVIPDWLFTNL